MPDYAALARLELASGPYMGAQPDDTADGSLVPSQGDPEPYGTKNTWRWNLQGGFAAELEDFDNRLLLAGGGMSYFLLDGLSIDFELSLVYVNQIGDDALALNFVMLARWHFFMADTWSLYGDIGAGILVSTSEVPGPDIDDPRGGSHFNFTPQLGAGVSVDIAPNVRLMAGARWHHISNARTHESNPPRDSLLIYAGVSMPF